MIKSRTITEIIPQKFNHYRAKASLLLKAYLLNECFYCNALAGESDFNICINSDLTVSCNCQDFSGKGRIGDLNKQSLEEIFDGTTARKFRAMLAARKIPLQTCVHCADLRRAPSRDAGYHQEKFRVPHRGIMVENTALCNLRCRSCNRELLLKQRNDKLSLSLQDVEKIARILRRHSIGSLLYFNLGEPFIPLDIYAQVRAIRAQNPGIRIITSTNGLLLDNEEKLNAALLMDYIYFSLDGIDQNTVVRYQAGGNFEKAFRNMTRLCALKMERGRSLPIVEWKYVLFRWNDKPAQIEKAIELAKKAKVDVIAFYNGDSPPLHKSLRWHFHPYFKKLGRKTNGSIIVNLHNIPQNLLSP